MAVFGALAAISRTEGCSTPAGVSHQQREGEWYMSEDQGSDLAHRIQELQSEHRSLDKELRALADDPLIDDLQIQRLKKRKLYLKDSIAHLESNLVPDITA